MSKGAYVLKALVGGDLLEAEKKGFNQRVHLRGDFNVGITCNADLNIRLEGDVGAWRRRLLVIKYDRSAPPKPIPDFADQLLVDEGPGIVRWMVEGTIELLNDLQERGNFILTDGQTAVRAHNYLNNLLGKPRMGFAEAFVIPTIPTCPGVSFLASPWRLCFFCTR